MNRKIPILVAGLALAATMTGCTKTAAPYVTPYSRIHRSTAAGDYAGNYGGVVDEPSYRYDGIAGNYRFPRAANGYVDSTGRWHSYNRANTGVQSGTTAPDGFPDTTMIH